jgi:hypothetical protein
MPHYNQHHYYLRLSSRRCPPHRPCSATLSLRMSIILLWILLLPSRARLWTWSARQRQAPFTRHYQTLSPLLLHHQDLPAQRCTHILYLLLSQPVRTTPARCRHPFWLSETRNRNPLLHQFLGGLRGLATSLAPKSLSFTPRSLVGQSAIVSS